VGTEGLWWKGDVRDLNTVAVNCNSAEVLLSFVYSYGYLTHGTVSRDSVMKYENLTYFLAILTQIAVFWNIGNQTHTISKLPDYKK